MPKFPQTTSEIMEEYRANERLRSSNFHEAPPEERIKRTEGRCKLVRKRFSGFTAAYVKSGQWLRQAAEDEEWLVRQYHLLKEVADAADALLNNGQVAVEFPGEEEVRQRVVDALAAVRCDSD